MIDIRNSILTEVVTFSAFVRVFFLVGIFMYQPCIERKGVICYTK